MPDPGAVRPSPVRVVFVCWGNICRSPMAERVAERAAVDAGIDGVEFTSAATSREEIGAPIDRRAAAVLARHGYRTDAHAAHQITRSEIDDADLVIGAEQIHLDRMRSIHPSADNLSLLSDYDPAATSGSGLPDPWYGEADGFEDTLAAVEAAMPGVLDAVRDLQGARRD